MRPAWTVLVVDDHPELRRLVKTILDVGGLQIVGEAADGSEALDLCRALNPDIVVLDIAMPVMDGIVAAGLIKKSCARTNIVLLSVHDDADSVIKGVNAGAMGYVVKKNAAFSLIPAIEAVQRGETFICEKIQPQVREAAAARRTG